MNYTMNGDVLEGTAFRIYPGARRILRGMVPCKKKQQVGTARGADLLYLLL